MVINTNTSAQNGALLLSQSSAKLAQSLARLSSGSKITSPADDAAGLAVSMRMGAQINRTDAANANLANALSFSATQDGYLSKVGDALDRMSELTVLAQDVTKTTADRSLYNQEFQTLGNFISDVQTKSFNGVSLFSGNALDVTTDSEGGTFSMTGVSANYVTPGVTTTTPVTGNTKLSDLGVSASDLASGIHMSLTDGHTASMSFNSNSTINDLVSFLNSDSTPGTASASFNSSTGQLTMTLGQDGYMINNQLDLNSNGDMLKDLGFNPAVAGPPTDFYYGYSNASHTYNTTLPTSLSSTTPAMDISSLSGAASARTQVESSISQLASDRATVGANLERMTYTASQLGTLKNNLTAAKSQITDVDVATESTNYARENILVQAGTAMLAQANSTPQSVLRLLG